MDRSPGKDAHPRLTRSPSKSSLGEPLNLTGCQDQAHMAWGPLRRNRVRYRCSCRVPRDRMLLLAPVWTIPDHLGRLKVHLFGKSKPIPLSLFSLACARRQNFNRSPISILHPSSLLGSLCPWTPRFPCCSHCLGCSSDAHNTVVSEYPTLANSSKRPRTVSRHRLSSRHGSKG